MIHNVLPPSLEEDIFRFEQEVAEFRAGRLHETAFVAKRLKMGLYFERNRLTYMCRIRCSGNIITPKQLAGVASLAMIYGNGKIHVTTRGEIQLHRLEQDDLISILRKLKKIGLSCKGGGGNTVRNIIANHDSGTSVKDVFDVQPCLQALTKRLLHESDSWELPRKMKISFSSLAKETAFCFIQDISFIAQLNTKGEQGFRVYVGGGLGVHPKVGVQLHEFIQKDEVYNVVKALKNLFHLYGNRKNKHCNRIKFLLHDDLGIAAFRTYYRQELNKVLEQGYAKLDVTAFESKDNKDNSSREITLAVQEEDSDDFQIWKKRHVRNQWQGDLCRVKIPLLGGDMLTDDCSALEKLLRPFGENCLRLGLDQNIYLINIPKKYLPNIYKEVIRYSTLSDRPTLYSNLVTCAGSEGCQVGLNAPKAATKAIFAYLDNVATANFCPPHDMMIRISGCPNACTKHWIAELGLYGKVRRVDGHLVPTYNVIGNGGMYGGVLRIAEQVGWVHAYDLPRFVIEVMRRYATFKELSQEAVDFDDYWRSGGKDIITELCLSGYNDIPTFAEDKNYYFDHGAEQLFSLKDIGRLECSAGIYDLIDVDHKIVQKNIRLLEKKEIAEKETLDSLDSLDSLLHNTLFHAARMLLVTRGEEPTTTAEVYSLFIKHFLDTGLIAATFQPLLTTVCQVPDKSLCRQKEQVIAFSKEVATLYTSMDNTMRFPGERENLVVKAMNRKDRQDALGFSAGDHGKKPDKFQDLTGVQCPLNFAQIKVKLFSMRSGEILEVLLDDDASIKQVPESIQLDGHSILWQEKRGEQWTVLIQKF
ncbi:Sulfite reductase subunit beta (Hemoprotein) [Candidatus Electrothrix gigas]